MKMMVVGLGALSASAFVLPGPAVAPAPMRVNTPVMQEQPKAPKSGWTLTLAGGSRTIEDVRAARKKAEKSYIQKDEVECDIKRYEVGWTTK